MKTGQKRFVSMALSFLLLVAVIVNTTACSGSVQAADMMEGISAQKVCGRQADSRFIGNTAEFSLELFKNSITAKQNSLVSPLSVLLALAMTANGADTETLSQMEAVLGQDIPLSELNEYFYSYAENLPSVEKAKLTIANSIWFRDDEYRLTVEKNFLQTNADYYGAAAYKSAFDDQTLKDINNWVKNNTDGMIEKILDEISDDAVMYLINAIVFDAEWKAVYNKNDIFQDIFTAIDGNTQYVDFMRSEENIYLDDGKATGFIKPYANDQYSFVALLPNADIAIQDYIETLFGESFLQTINGGTEDAVSAILPKFSYDYTIKMNDCLESLGMPNAFSGSEADFRKLGSSSRGNIFIGEVLHKTYISVDELGTKAGAVTKVEMRDTSAPAELKIVKLSRPFVYAIIDNASKLPIFIGTVMELDE